MFYVSKSDITDISILLQSLFKAIFVNGGIIDTLQAITNLQYTISVRMDYYEFITSLTIVDTEEDFIVNLIPIACMKGNLDMFEYFHHGVLSELIADIDEFMKD